jgi:hypothetical protein
MVASALLGVAQVRLEKGLAPSPALMEAEASLDQAEAGVKSPDESLYLRGQLALLQGRQKLAAGRDPSPDWQRAEAAFQNAVARSRLAQAHAGAAEARARAYLHRGRAADRAQTLLSARAALKRDPLRAEAWLWIAVVEQEAHRRGDPRAEPRAREAWSQALALDANLRRQAKTLGMP